MKNKEFKLLLESWKSNFIVEAYDEDDHDDLNNSRRFDSGEVDNENSSESYEDFKKHSEEYENHNVSKEEEIEKFARMFDIEVESLRDFLTSQAFMGGVEELESGEVLNPESGEIFGDDEEIH